MAKERKKHTAEFKRDAVRMMRNRGSRTVAQIADDLGVNPNQLHFAEFRGERPVFDGRPIELEVGCADAQFLFERHENPPATTDADWARRLLDEAQLFIEACHSCEARVSTAPPIP